MYLVFYFENCSFIDLTHKLVQIGIHKNNSYKILAKLQMINYNKSTEVNQVWYTIYDNTLLA